MAFLEVAVNVFEAKATCDEHDLKVVEELGGFSGKGLIALIFGGDPDFSRPPRRSSYQSRELRRLVPQRSRIPGPFGSLAAQFFKQLIKCFHLANHTFWVRALSVAFKGWR